MGNEKKNSRIGRKQIPRNVWYE